MDVWDDVNGNGWPPDQGDGWGALDLNGNQQWPDNEDGLLVEAGNTYQVDFTLYELEGKSLRINRNFGPIPGSGR